MKAKAKKQRASTKKRVELPTPSREEARKACYEGLKRLIQSGGGKVDHANTAGIFGLPGHPKHRWVFYVDCCGVRPTKWANDTNPHGIAAVIQEALSLAQQAQAGKAAQP